MTMLSPAATFNAELREQLGHVGRALSVQRALVWLTRGVALGTVAVLGVVIWAWSRDGVSALPLPYLAAVPLGLGLLVGVATFLVRHDVRQLARRVDRAASLQERSTTALELGAQGADFPLALAQMRDAVEHLKRLEPLEVFPLRAPRRELLTIFFVALIAVLVAISPNPWLLRARASNPAITIAREQAQRVQRLADSMPVADNPELQSLRELVSKGARTVDARSNEPDAALNALQDLEEQVRQMSAGDDQLSAALAAIASALASDPSTQQLSAAINTGDLKEIARATRDLAQQASQMSGQDQQRVAKVLRDASDKAGRASQSVAGQLSDAASALQQAGAAAQATDAAQAGQQAGDASSAGANAQSAADALNQLANDAASAAERQRTESQLESSRNALERALGRTQSRSGSSGSTGRSSSTAGSQRSQSPAAGGQGSEPGDNSGGGQGSGEQGANGESGNGSPSSGDQSGTGDGTQGGGYSTGGQNQNRTGEVSPLDTIPRPEQVPSNSNFEPDMSSQNPYLGQAGDGSAQAGEEAVQPTYSNKATQGNESSTIPLGLRDLVKDYFSSLDQK
jgi:hypothetical protein